MKDDIPFCDYSNIDCIISCMPEIEKKKQGFLSTLFGLPYRLYHKNSASRIKSYSGIFHKDQLDDILHLVRTGRCKDIPPLHHVCNGNVMIKMYMSKDKQFVALQASRFIDFSYKPITDIYSYSGNKAQFIIETIM